MSIRPSTMRLVVFIALAVPFAAVTILVIPSLAEQYAGYPIEVVAGVLMAVFVGMAFIAQGVAWAFPVHDDDPKRIQDYIDSMFGNGKRGK